jgi:hypothetical protein
MNDLPGALELLSSRVDDLEKRVHALERPSEAIVPAREESLGDSAALAADDNQAEQTSGVFAVLGRGMLGIAGAYVLRAVAASGSLPELAVATVAIAYAMAWLVWAAWSRNTTKFVQVVYAGASAVILAPMLWELTLHFKTFSPFTSATVLGAYVVLAEFLYWKKGVAPVAWVADGATALAALALGIATNVLLPFIATLLLLVALCEYATFRGRGEGIRPLVVLVSDVAIFTLLFIYAGPPNTRADYPNPGAAALIAPAWLLWALNGISLTIKTTVLERTMSVFEAIQTMVAFGLAVSSVLYFAPVSGTMVLGLVCLVLSICSYVALFRRLLHSTERRNRLVFSLWSAALTLAGVIWLLPQGAAATCLAAGSLAAIVSGVRMRCALLELHGLVFLVAAAVLSRSPQYAFGELAGTAPLRPGPVLIAAAVCSTLFYAASKERPAEEWQQQILHFVPALLAALALSALLVQGLLGLASSVMSLAVHHVAFIRTLTLCAVSVVFAFGGSRWDRLEMKRIAYAALAFVAAKLLFEDLQHGRMEFIAGSIFLFAITLIAVPRLVRVKKTTKVALKPASVLQQQD